MDSPHPAFELLSATDLPEYRGRGLHLRHLKTGCEVYHLLCGDEENTFAFGFRTPSRDSTGAAHIIEHSVLCGSEAYPVKDPFLVMARRSLATYLNALTYPDRTIYPGSSAVEADYFNLMSVYGDAVFFPRISEDTLAQEGHHLEFTEEGRLKQSGVVYNEMRGDYSSGDSLIGAAVVQSLFEPGHPYSFDSGGDPEVIPELDYPGFVDFWASNYHPGNCRIFLYGNIDTGKQLAYLEAQFLSRVNPLWKLAAGPVADVPLAAARAIPERRRVAIPPEAGSEGKTSVIVTWLLPEFANPEESLAVELLGELIMGHDGAPLAKALRASGLGEDLSPHSGLDGNFRQGIFSAGLRGTEDGAEDAVEKVVLDCLRDFVAKGLEAGALDGALHSMTFASKEIRRGSGTFGTRVMTRAYRSWIRGHSPNAGLAVDEPLARLKAKVEGDPAWLGSLIHSLFLDNPHRVTLTTYPDPGLFERRERVEEATFETLKASLSPEEIQGIKDKAQALRAAQERPESPEALASLPRLRSRDLPRTVDRIPREPGTVAGLEASIHPLFTNGIVYLDLAIPLGKIAKANLLWLPLFSRFLPAAGLPGRGWAEVAGDLTRKAGGFGIILESGTTSPASGSKPLSYLIFRLKALTERFPEALALALDLMTQADTTDEVRIQNLQDELCNDVLSALVPGGNSFAIARAGASRSESLKTDDLWRGMGQFRFLSRLSSLGKEGGAAGVLEGLKTSLIAREGARLNLTASPEDLPGALAVLEAELPRLPAFPGAPLAPKGFAEEFLAPAAPREAYAIPSKVGFMASAQGASRLGSPEFAHESVLAHLLSTGPLWDELRVRRGAYGASCFIEGLEGAAFFSTYRDPRPAESFAFYAEALGRLAKAALPEDLVEEAVIGCVGRDLRPLLPEERGLADFRRELYGIDEAMRLGKREALLATTPGDIQAAADRLSQGCATASGVLLSRDEDVQLFERQKRDTIVVDLSL